MELAKLKEYAQSNEPIKGSLEGPIEGIETAGLGLMYPIHYEASVYSVDNIWTLILTINFKYKTTCSRCLKEIEEPVESQVDFLVTETAEEAQFYEENSEEEVLVWEARESFLRELVMSVVVTSIPMQALCKEDCKGLCPTCGKDLNTGDCDCETSDIDPRFSALQGLFDEE